MLINRIQAFMDLVCLMLDEEGYLPNSDISVGAVKIGPYKWRINIYLVVTDPWNTQDFAQLVTFTMDEPMLVWLYSNDDHAAFIDILAMILDSVDVVLEHEILHMDIGEYELHELLPLYE